MGVISSLRDSCEMRVLVLSAFFACAAAAPSGALFGTLTPLTVPIIANIPTISPGDIQAAAIDAKVKVEDAIRAVADRNRELFDQAIENQNEKVIEVNDLLKEKSQEAFWSAEDTKWQALTALQTAEAKIDGTVASNADLLGKAVLNGVVVSPVVSRIYSNVIPDVATADCQTPLLKAAENPEATKNEGDKDSVQVESAVSDSESEKAAAGFVRNLEAQAAAQAQSIPEASVGAAPASDVAGLRLSEAPAAVAPIPEATAALPEAPVAISEPVAPAVPLPKAPAIATPLSIAQALLPSPSLAVAPLPAAAIATAPVATASLLSSPLTIPGLKLEQQWLTGPVFVQPGLKAISPVSLQSPLVPTLIKTPC
ncbi:LOW QUALITY PROTEIN: pupal cuticle protein PCP52-like [Achroia grisella]|uniref:LOW QUALITY PROTEIN: pupal cuticle protein PCP52-like n=1 Tax=Achroia grisella TaxID=688607 RepID=UPI0027D1ECAB|nr:LOW QUALITY PROTEIN: pupal cuticle protein PCP52-like [Achroia grisella]